MFPYINSHVHVCNENLQVAEVPSRRPQCTRAWVLDTLSGIRSERNRPKSEHRAPTSKVSKPHLAHEWVRSGLQIFCWLVHCVARGVRRSCVIAAAPQDNRRRLRDDLLWIYLVFGSRFCSRSGSRFGSITHDLRKLAQDLTQHLARSRSAKVWLKIWLKNFWFKKVGSRLDSTFGSKSKRRDKLSLEVWFELWSSLFVRRLERIYIYIHYI